MIGEAEEQHDYEQDDENGEQNIEESEWEDVTDTE